MSPPPEPRRLLWILRHAKTQTEPPRGGSDHERELNPRGRRDARALGRRLAQGDRLSLARGDLPGVVLCSTAARTLQTAERVLGGWAKPAELRRERVLYGADPEEVLDQVRLVEDQVRSVMVIGHNPTLTELAELMIAPIVPPGGSVDRRGFPTCAMAVIGLPQAHWSKVSPGTAGWARLFTPPY